MSGAFRAIDPASTQERDPDRLYMLDRACLRLLLRCGAATSVQLAALVYGNVRLAQYHVLRLHRAGLIERTAIVETPGRAEYAYRVGPSGHQRLGTRRTPAPATYVRHMLDTVDAVRALNRSSDREHPPVQLWLADSMTGDVLGRFVRPDSIVVVTTGAGSAVLALEIDEATEHSRTIRAKFAAYRRPIGLRPNWHLVVVVPSVSAPTGRFGRRPHWTSARKPGLSPAPTSPETRSTRCSGHSPQVHRRARSARCSSRPRGCTCPRRFARLARATGGRRRRSRGRRPRTVDAAGASACLMTRVNRS